MDSFATFEKNLKEGLKMAHFGGGGELTRFVCGFLSCDLELCQGILGSLKQIVGGNIESYAEVCEQARQDAYKRMVKHAKEIDADAVIGMRYDATEFAQSTTEVLAYGTAVKLANA